MGEKAQDLQGARAGQFTLNDWLGQQNNQATPKGMLPFILPVQEMRGFQRLWRFSSGAQDLAIGEILASVRWPVPDREFWRIRGIFFDNPDNVDHTYATDFTVNLSLLSDDGLAVGIYRAALINIAAQARKVIYGLDIQTRTNTDIYSQSLDMTLEPGDVLSVKMGEVASVAHRQTWTMLYELVPGTPQQRVPGVVGLKVVT